MSEIRTEPTAETTWAAAAVPIGLGQVAPACSGGATFLRVQVAPSSPVDADSPGLLAEVARHAAASTRGDKHIATLRRLRAQNAAAAVREAEARATIGALQVKRKAALDAAGDGLEEVLVRLGREMRAAEDVLRGAAETMAVLSRPVASATEAARGVFASAAQMAARTMAAALVARQEELVARLCGQSAGILTELAQIQQRLGILSEENVTTTTIRTLMQS